MAKNLAMFFLEHGSVMSEDEYFSTNPVPYPRATLRNIFGSYPRAVNYAKFACKEAFAEMEANEKPKPKPAVKEPKEDALEALAKGKKVEKSND